MKDYSLVVIGAHTGFWLDQEIKKNLEKNILLVEPVPYNYQILEKNYSKYKNIEICKNAILDNNEIRKFFFIKKNSIDKLNKHWASGIGSFNKNHILDHYSKRFKVTNLDIDEIEIEFIKFNDLLKKYSIKKLKNFK